MEKLTDNIIELNRDVEPLVIQAGTGRLHPFKDPYQPLQFVHFSDLHRYIRAWDRPRRIYQLLRKIHLLRPAHGRLLRRELGAA
ncbi:MAG: hypothetical protein IJ012_04700 [Clostridia bacterium]|nr:hypothetical protein [Clostridia bacterium]